MFQLHTCFIAVINVQTVIIHYFSFSCCFVFFTFSLTLQILELFVICYKEVTHPNHTDKMEEPVPRDQHPANRSLPEEQMNAILETSIHVLMHVSQCRNPHCMQEDCIQIKREIAHFKECRWVRCPICGPILGVCLSHARNCTVEHCLVYGCENLKEQLKG